LVHKTAVFIITVILLVSIFTFIAELNLADAYNNKDFNFDRTSWPMFHGNFAHTGYSQSILAPKTNNTIWKFSCSDRFWYPATVVGGIIYIGSAQGNVYAINASTGGKLWRTLIVDGVTSSPVVERGVLYVGRLSGISALNASTGNMLWSFSSPISYWVWFTSPIVINNTVYVASSDCSVYALNAINGQKIWNSTVGMIISPLAFVNNVLYASSYDDGYVYALSATNGGVIWKSEVGECVLSSPTFSEGVVYVGSNYPFFYALNASTGEKLWYFTANERILSCPCVANGVVYFGSDDCNVYALNATTGKKLWNNSVGQEVETDIALAGSILYVSTYRGEIYALNAKDGSKVWSYKIGSTSTDGPSLSSPVIANGVVFVGSYNGMVYAFGYTPAPAPTHDSP
jgi:outer membrane protein assembly factor BamB